MSLPTLADYDPPTELPASRAQWTVVPARAALLVHDMQRYFLRPYPSDGRALDGAVASIAALLDAARSAGVPVVYTAAGGAAADRGLQNDLWGPGMRAAAEDTAIVDAVAPRDGETVLTKHRYSAFVRTGLDGWLRERGRDQLVITGVYAHIGVLATAFDAFCRDVAPFLVADAVAAFDRAGHERALATAAQSCAVVTTTAGVRAALAGDAILRAALGGLLDEPGALRRALDNPDEDLFALGLDSIRAMSLIDALADRGVDVDFGEFIGAGTVGFLRERIDAGITPAAG